MEIAYPTEMTDAQWQAITRLIPPAKEGGRSREVDMRSLVNSIFYLVRTGCAWRMLPKEYPPWQTVYYYFARFKKDGTWQQIHDLLRTRVRHKVGKHKQPTAAIIDSQSVKTTEKGGYTVTMQARK
jgi:putative transposase